jgi:outer membrane receptor protein involved in Fe transport
MLGFGGGVLLDYAHFPAAAIDHIEVIRGPQSAVYGPYANSGVVDFVTRQPEAGLHLEVLAEGGTYHERRFGITAAGTVAGFGIAASASRLDTDGPVVNNDYRNEDVLLHLTRRFGRQRLAFGGYFDSNEAGEPGPWGSNPKGTFTGIDTISREKTNITGAFGRYELDLSDRFREELMGSFFQNNYGFRSQFGFSFNKDQREQGEARTTAVLSPHDVAAFGVWAAHEEVSNTYITDADFSAFPMGRNDIAVYGENRWEFRGRLFLNAGVRAEWIRTPEIPPDGFSRPQFPANNIARVNPKLAASWLLAPGTRVHGSLGLGFRPPNGFELAFTNNPSLKPERTRSVDAGVEQKLLHDRMLLDATYFYNRYYDLIVSLGGSLKSLSHYQTANLANSRAYGAEFSAGVRPARCLFLRGSYTFLDARILSLEGTQNQAPLPFQVGQPLTRRPKQSGAFIATFTRGRIAADVTGYFRGKALFEEPSFGASNGLFWDAGFANVGFNLNYRLVKGVTAYGHLRNALNRYYEEVFGYPSPRLNFVAGLKWELL